MNYDEAIKAFKDLHPDYDTTYNGIYKNHDKVFSALKTAKKEHELLGLKDQMIATYRDHINFLLYGSQHGKQLDVKTVCEIVTKITELESELK